MAIKELVEFIGQSNITDEIDEDTLMQLGSDVITRFDQDMGSMEDWAKSVDFGLDLVKQELHPKSTPWDGASNFKSSILTEAALAFGNRASLELLRSRNLVKADVIGKDETGEKQKRADRVTEASNYQINYEMKEWRKDQKRLMYTLPNVGTIFKKPVFDPLLGRNISHIIHYPDFAVNQATTDIATARSFTHILDISQNKIFENEQAGIWRDVDLYPEDSEGDEGSNEKEEVTDSTDNPNRFLEQYCFADLDDDGYEEPYIVTVHEQSRKVVRVVARFDERSIIVTGDNDVVMSLFEVQQEQRKEREKFAQSLNIETQEAVDEFKGLKLARIEAAQPITKYGFIPSQDGTFLDLGYFHLIGGTTMAVNTTTNQLIDGATLNNVGGGFLAKGFRKKMGPIQFRPGEYKSTEVQAGQLAGSIFPMPTKEPSQTLFALNEKLDLQGRQFAGSVDAGGQIQANTAPTTALAIIQEQLIPQSALMSRVIDAMSEEFQQLFRLNQNFFDPQLYQTILDDPDANFEEDFRAEGFDIVPTANSEMSSKMQRIQLAEVQMSMFDRVLQAQGNPIPIVKNFFEIIGSDIVDQVFPDESQMDPREAQALQQLREQQERQNQLLEQQNQLQQRANEITDRQITVLEQAEGRKGFEAETKALKTDSDIAKDQAARREVEAKIGKIKADILLTLEQAETEALNNQIAKYTRDLQAQESILARLIRG